MYTLLKIRTCKYILDLFARIEVLNQFRNNKPKLNENNQIVRNTDHYREPEPWFLQ